MSSKKMKPLTHLEPFLKTRIKDVSILKEMMKLICKLIWLLLVNFC